MRQPVAAQARCLRSSLGNLGQIAAVWWAGKWGWAVETDSVSQGAGSALKLYIHIGDMNAALSETCSLLSVVPVSEKCPCRLYFSVAIHSQPWAKVVLKDSPPEHPGTSPRNSVPWLEGVSVSMLENLQNWFPPCPLPPLLLPSLSFSSLPSLTARLCFRRVHWMAFPAFPIPPHSSSLWGRNVLPSSW